MLFSFGLKNYKAFFSFLVFTAVNGLFQVAIAIKILVMIRIKWQIGVAAAIIALWLFPLGFSIQMFCYHCYLIKNKQTTFDHVELMDKMYL